MTRFLDLVEARIAAADPQAAAARAEAAALSRFVRAGATDEHGLRTLIARAHAGDVTYLVAVLDRIASVLAAQGDRSCADVRRAAALRILANPARALQLLTAAALEPTTDEPGGAAESIAWMRDSAGRVLPGEPVRGDLELVGGEEAALSGLLSQPVLADADADEAPHPTSDTEVLHEVLRALEGFDSSQLDPVTVFQVHLSQEALAEGRGVARVEGIGAMVLEQLRQWLAEADQRIQLRAVVDARSVVAVDRYEFTEAMQEVVRARLPYEVFPYGTLPSRTCDLDHPVAYSATGPPAQTGLHNVGPLGRKHHRIKTFGRWALHHPEPGVYWWRTPTGHWLRVDPSGTRHHGRDAELDRRWLCAAHNATPAA